MPEPRNTKSGTIVAVAIVLVTAALLAVWTAAGNATSDVYQNPDVPAATEREPEEQTGPSENQLALERAADELFSQMADGDPSFVAQLAQRLDDDFFQATGYRHADLGMDAASLARWMLEDFRYEIATATVGTNTGVVSVSFDHRAGRAMVSNFYDLAYDFFASPEAEGLDEASARLRMGELYRQALNESTAMDSVHTQLTFTRIDGVWHPNDDALESLLDKLFGVYRTADGKERADDESADTPSGLEAAPAGQDGAASGTTADAAASAGSLGSTTARP